MRKMTAQPQLLRDAVLEHGGWGAGGDIEASRAFLPATNILLVFLLYFIVILFCDRCYGKRWGDRYVLASDWMIGAMASDRVIAMLESDRVIAMLENEREEGSLC